MWEISKFNTAQSKALYNEHLKRLEKRQHGEAASGTEEFSSLLSALAQEVGSFKEAGRQQKIFSPKTFAEGAFATENCK